MLGGGPIGLSVIQALKARGCEKIIVSEVSSMRKQYASDFGAHHILDPAKDDIVAKCRELCDGKGAHMVFDCAGVQSALNQAVKAIRARGTIVNIAENTVPLSLEPVPSLEPVGSVLELTGGRTAELGIKAGDKVEWVHQAAPPAQ